MNADLRLDRQPRVVDATRDAARDLLRTLGSPRASRRDVLDAIDRVPGFADRLRALSLPVRRDLGRRRPLEAVVAVLGHERLRRLLLEHLGADPDRQNEEAA